MSLPAHPPVRPSFREALGVWMKIGLLSFGGPTGQIALMHGEIVEKRRWVSDARFVHALNYCMLLPGPEAQQLSIYVGWLLHGVRGGIAAGMLFVLPGAFLLWGISWLYVSHGTVPAVAAIFYGLKPAVLAIVAFAVLRISQKILNRRALWVIAAAAFAGIFWLKLPFPLIVLGAGLVGLLGGCFFPEQFRLKESHGATGVHVISDDSIGKLAAPDTGRAVRTAILWSVIWAAPLVATGLVFGSGHVLFQEGLFFSKASLVTFGGAYAVLPYVAQQAVETHGWLTATQMIDGLGLAETTPGPLVLVLQHVGFLGAWSHPAPFSPLAAATLGSLMTTWCTFVPGFLFIFVGAPYVEAIRANELLSRALSAITAAVVGIVLNLAVWFGLNVLLPGGGSVDWFSLGLTIAAFFALQKLRWDVIRIVVACGALGFAYRLFL
ncbi:MAG: chromate efflux transporter [Candidatus Didemnitutus sp.]|nr:chromate efflux transporter [Candidatus Didemnitutus sp.]